MAPNQAPHVPDVEPTRDHPNAHPSTPIVSPVEPDGGALDWRELPTPQEALEFVIPPGTAPEDPSIPIEDLHRYSDNPAPHDTAGNRYDTGKRGFHTDNEAAFPVFERASSDWNAGAIVVTSNNAGTAIVGGRQRGRKAITLSVPTTWTDPNGTVSTPNGVTISQTEGELQNGSGYQLNPGDSVTISTEAPVWAGLIPTKTTGVVQWIVEYNPAGGELTGQ